MVKQAGTSGCAFAVDIERGQSPCRSLSLLDTRHVSSPVHQRSASSGNVSAKTSPVQLQLLPTPAKLSSHAALLVGAAGSSYCLSSVGMVLVNKVALTAFPGGSPLGLLFLQCGICAVLAGSAQLMGLVKGQRLGWRVAWSWFPSNLLFVAMLWTSIVALKYLTVPMVAVLKSLTNVFTILGDCIIFRRTYSAGIWWSLLLIMLSSIAGGIFDLHFNATGYAWQLLNCLLTAAYSLYIKKAIQEAAQHSPDRRPLSESSMVLLNNTLCLPVLFVMLVATGEWQSIVIQAGRLATQEFALVAIVSGVVAFALSYSSLWFLSVSTPTSYSLVGNLNKLPAAIGSYIMFHDRTLTSAPSVASLMLGVLGGMVFVSAKTKMTQMPSPAQGTTLHPKEQAAVDGELLLPSAPQLPLSPLPRRHSGGQRQFSSVGSTESLQAYTDPLLQDAYLVYMRAASLTRPSLGTGRVPAVAEL